MEYLISNALGEKKTAVILAGGSEDKLRISKEDYRMTAFFKNSRVIEHSIKKLKENGFKNIFIVAQAVVLTKLFDILKDGSKYGVAINYIEEKEAKGTAASLKLLKGKINTNFLVVYGDIIFNKMNIEELWNSHLRQRGAATIMLTTSNEPSKKGVVKIEGNKILNFTQKPKQADNYIVFSPIIAAAPEILEYKGDSLEQNVFPVLAEKGMLYGHLSSEKEKHIHNLRDLE